MLLKNKWLELQVIRPVVLGGIPFLTSDNPKAQETSDSTGSRWHVCDALGTSVCVVEWRELEQAKKDGLIDFEHLS
jgi:hypothetical protein